MSTLRIGALLLAIALALPCFFPAPGPAFAPPETIAQGKTEAQAEREKEKLREKLDAERAKAYEPYEEPPKSQKQPLEILIHRGGTQ